jgi:hypothetical protein
MVPVRNPIGAYQRKAVAARRIGAAAKCACGETRPGALTMDTETVICVACKRRKRGQATMDDHHFAGRANSTATIPIPVNDHRAALSMAQYDWPKTTLENPHGSPMLAAAAHIRGFGDTVSYLLKKLVWIAEMLEAADLYLCKLLGPRWWHKTEIEQWLPRR